MRLIKKRGKGTSLDSTAALGFRDGNEIQILKP